MRSMWTRGLALALGLVASTQAQEPAAPVIASIGKPITIGKPQPVAPVASIAKPVAAAPVTDPALRPVGFERPVFRGVSPDPSPARPMPSGAGTDPGMAGLHGWRRPDQPTSGTIVEAPGNLTMLGGTAGPVQSGPVLGGQVIGSTQVVPGQVGGPVVSGPVVGGAMDCVDPCIGSACGYGGWGPAAAGACDPCNSRFYLSAEYLMWWAKGDNTPPLVTTSNSPFSPVPPINASLADPGAQVLFGGNAMGESIRSGLRMMGGVWFTDDRALGLEIGGFFLGEKTTRLTAGGGFNGTVVGRPFLNMFLGVNNPFEDKELVAGENQLAGTVTILHRSSLWGYEANLKRNFWCGESFTLDGLIGLRHVALDESLGIRENLTVEPTLAALLGYNGTIVQDKFATTNRFWGAQIGAQCDIWLLERLSLGVSTKVGLGYTWSRSRIDGSTQLTQNGALLPGGSGVGGLLALPSNIGHHQRESFSVVPEVGLTLNYQFTSWLRGMVGYNFLYWNNVMRPGGQIDTRVNALNTPFNPTGVQNNQPLLPAALNRTTDFWAHGLNIGLMFTF